MVDGTTVQGYKVKGVMLPRYLKYPKVWPESGFDSLPSHYDERVRNSGEKSP